MRCITHPRSGAEQRPTSINTWLKNHPEYVLRFADRAYKHMFNDGALTPENGRSQWEARAAGIREAMKADIATTSVTISVTTTVKARLYDGSIIASLRYDDRAPWPLSPDGDGRSLTAVAPSAELDPGELANWRRRSNAGR